MSDQKISELTNITGANLADADEFVVVDVSADQTKAVTRAEFFKDTPDITATGTVTAGGLTVDGGANSELRIDTDAAGYLQVGQFTNGAFIGTSSTNATYGKLRLGAGTKRFIDVGTNGDISFYEDTGTTPKFFWDASTERLGIGTAAPAYAIDVEKPTADAIQLKTTGATTASILLGVKGGATTLTSAGLQANNNGSLSVLTGTTSGSEAMTIAADGSVGIGDTSPSEALSVTGNIAATGTVTAGDVNITGPSPVLTLTDNDVANRWSRLYNENGDTFIDLRNGGVGGQFIIRGFGSGVADEYARFDANGDFGINNTSPATALDVSGTVTATAFAGTSVGVGTGYGTGFTIENNKHQINANDGGGNFNIRVANDFQTGITETGYASHWAFTQASGLWEFHTTTASQSVGTTPVWQVPMSISKEGNIGVLGTVTATSYTEAVFVITGTTPALDPVNGSIQTWTLTAASTPTSSLSSGESMTLMIEDGTAYSITWPTMTWVNNGGAAPTLATSGKTVVALWNVAGNLYGSFVGNGS